MFNLFRNGKDLTFSRYNEGTRDTAVYPSTRVHILKEHDKVSEVLKIERTLGDILYPLLGLANEVGEVLGKVKKAIRDERPLDDLPDELGDVLYYLDRVADELGTSLEDIARDNRDKLVDRKKRGVIKGDGDKR